MTSPWRYLRGEVPGAPPDKRRMYPTKQIAVAQMQIRLQQIKAIWFQAVTEACANPTKELDLLLLELLERKGAPASSCRRRRPAPGTARRKCAGRSSRPATWT